MAMPRVSAGLLMYRIQDGKLQVLLAHPGGPLFKNKDDDSWTIPKGEIDPGEDLFMTAIREFEEETGFVAREWAYAGEIHNAAAYSTESLWLWFARDLQPGPAQLDAGEFVELVCMGASELEALEARDLLPDVKTLIGLRWLQQMQAGHKACAWRSAPAAAAL